MSWYDPRVHWNPILVLVLILFLVFILILILKALVSLTIGFQKGIFDFEIVLTNRIENWLVRGAISRQRLVLELNEIRDPDFPVREACNTFLARS